MGLGLGLGVALGLGVGIICLPCKYAKPSRTIVMYVRLSDSLKAPKRSSRLAIDPPG